MEFHWLRGNLLFEYLPVNISQALRPGLGFFNVCPAGHTDLEVKVLYRPDRGNC
jgi:hypothetical protein